MIYCLISNHKTVALIISNKYRVLIVLEYRVLINTMLRIAHMMKEQEEAEIGGGKVRCGGQGLVL